MSRPFAPGFTIPTDLLLRAYAAGVFPMAETADDPEIFWVRPELRGIIPLDDFHVPRSLAKTIKHAVFDIRFDTDFAGIISSCGAARIGRPNTWINQPIREAYARLYEIGHCHTVEAWQGDRLVGGLYGVTMGRVFFGESMFSFERDASKVCLVALVERLRTNGFDILDTQFTTDHLKRFGAIDVPRRKYEIMLESALSGEPAIF